MFSFLLKALKSILNLFSKGGHQVAFPFGFSGLCCDQKLKIQKGCIFGWGLAPKWNKLAYAQCCGLAAYWKKKVAERVAGSRAGFHIDKFYEIGMIGRGVPSMPSIIRSGHYFQRRA